MPSPWWSFKKLAKTFLRTRKAAWLPLHSRMASGSARQIFVSLARRGSLPALPICPSLATHLWPPQSAAADSPGGYGNVSRHKMPATNSPSPDLLISPASAAMPRKTKIKLGPGCRGLRSLFGLHEHLARQFHYLFQVPPLAIVHLFRVTAHVIDRHVGVR